jgi:membrane fusion protein (multidrug efflux system)
MKVQTQAKVGKCIVQVFLLLVLCGWSAWALLAQVPVYVVSDSARLEVQNAGHPVCPLVGGKVVEHTLVIGRSVTVGEVVLVLDNEAERRAIAEHETRRKAIDARQATLYKEIAAEQDVLTLKAKAAQTAILEFQAQKKAADARSLFADRQERLYRRLLQQNAASELERSQSLAEADTQRAAAQALRLGAARQEQERAAEQAEHRARLAKLQREQVELEGESAIEAAAIWRLELDLENHRVRAPVSGRVGDAVPLSPGLVVRAGDRLGAIVPSGEPRVVAHLAAASVGRIQPGQSAQVRLDGFPWTQFGTLAATVARVGEEAHEGQIRVELTLERQDESRIPLEHGLTGSVEIVVERITPATLLLRAAGQAVGRPAVDH